MPMFWLVALNTNLLLLVIVLLVVMLLGMGLRHWKQPLVIAYMIAGVLLGKDGFGVVTDERVVTELGDLGVILLLFFIGMEISLTDFLKRWKIALGGTVLQIGSSIGLMLAFGTALNWSIPHSIVLGMVISLSSSAVIIKLLQDRQESHSPTGQSVISILLMQDILLVPMLIAIQYLGGQTPTVTEIGLQVLGGMLLVGGMVWLLRQEHFNLPFSAAVEADHELQVFFAGFVCFGCAVLSAFFGLSAALGAFVAGMVVHAARSTDWFEESLHAFRVVFVALFFISIGMLIDLDFIRQHYWTILGVLMMVYLTNHFINACVLYFSLKDWRQSIYGGALLAQMGELGFILMSMVAGGGIVSDFVYQLTVVTIALTLLISPFWISLTEWLLRKAHPTQ